MNLMNRLNDKSIRKTAMSLFIRPKNEDKKEIKLINVEEDFNPFISKTTIFPPMVNEIPSEPLVKTIESVESLTAFLPIPLPSATDLISNSENQIKLSLAHDSALDVLTRATAMIGEKLDDIKADRLPAVIAATSKVVESIRRERSEASKNNKDREVHYHFYTPSQKKISDYEVIDVTA